MPKNSSNLSNKKLKIQWRLRPKIANRYLSPKNLLNEYKKKRIKCNNLEKKPSNMLLAWMGRRAKNIIRNEDLYLIVVHSGTGQSHKFIFFLGAWRLLAWKIARFSSRKCACQKTTVNVAAIPHRGRFFSLKLFHKHHVNSM